MDKWWGGFAAGIGSLMVAQGVVAFVLNKLDAKRKARNVGSPQEET